MEFWPPVPDGQVGGLEILKQYLINRKKAFEPGNEHLPKPKALLLGRYPGNGEVPLMQGSGIYLRLAPHQAGYLCSKGSLVGESERKIRQATATIDAFGRAVVWLDEIDKGFAGVKSSGSTDGGTTSSHVRPLPDLDAGDHKPCAGHGDGQQHQGTAAGVPAGGTVRCPVFRRSPERAKSGSRSSGS